MPGPPRTCCVTSRRSPSDRGELRGAVLRVREDAVDAIAVGLVEDEAVRGAVLVRDAVE